MRKLWFWAATATFVLAACGGNASTSADGGGGEHGGGHTGDEAAECSPSGPSLSVVAKNSKFDATCLAAPSGEAFTVKFDNEDALPHNFAVLPESGKGRALFDTGVFTGPEVRDLEAGPLEAGQYRFHCVVHPNMVGTFVVQ